MELLYLRINEYKGLSNLEINLTNRFRFLFNEKENILEIKETGNYIESFFSKNISNFTGVIGQNGTGKTSILRYIMQYLGDGNYEVDENCIVVFGEDKKLYYYSPTAINVNALSNIGIENVENLDAFKKYTTLVFVSSHFDPTFFYSYDAFKQQLGDTINLSTNYLLTHDIQKRRIFKDTANEKLPFEEYVSAFSAQEFIRIVKLLRWITTKKRRNPFPAELPPYLNLKLYYNDDSPNRDRYLELRNVLRIHFRKRQSKKDKFLINTFEAGIFHFIDEGLLSINQGYKLFVNSMIDRIIDYVANAKVNQNENTVKKITAIISQLGRHDLWKSTGYKLRKLDKFIKELSKYLDKSNSQVELNETGISIKLSQSTIGSLSELIEDFYNVAKIGDYAEFYFSHEPFGESSLSSGEYSLLSLFGRLSSFKFDEYKRNLLFLIDEAELALHPDWQRRFLDVFTEFISQRFSKHNIQVILTSHSPFILSDLPPHCVVLLKREGESVVAVDSLQKYKETFGANIHELFTDSFFLQDGLMGEFSRRKIEELISEIKEEKDNSITLEVFETKYRSRVDIIGEQFLKAKILELIASKADVTTVELIIERRTQELDILNQIRKQKADDQNRTSQS